MSDVIVRVEHIRQAQLCARGARMWFTHHGLDYQRFLREGLPASEVEATGDALGLKVVEVARRAAAGEDE